MKTTQRERYEVMSRLERLGIDYNTAQSLRRISLQLHAWFERECGDGNGCIERDEETGKTYWLDAMTGKRWPIPDRETGAKRRLARIMKQLPTLRPYIQGDCRGISLYILRCEDLRPGENIEQVYNRGIAVY